MDGTEESGLGSTGSKRVSGPVAVGRLEEKVQSVRLSLMESWYHGGTVKIIII